MMRPVLFVACAASLLMCSCGVEVEQEVDLASPPNEAAVPGEDSDQEVVEAVTVAALDAQPAASTDYPYHNPLTREQMDDGWISLFDGFSLHGWTPNDPDVNWSVQDGIITADAGPIGLLNTNVPFTNYELICEYRMEAGGNSGIFMHTETKPGDVKTKCYELNMADEHPQGYLTGSLVGRAKTAEPIQGSGGWKTFHVTLDQGHIVVELDGEQVLDYTDPNPIPSGLLGLQKNAGKIEFRKVLLKPLGMTPLFNGADLTGWREVPESKSEFAVEEGAIHVSNGPGFLETEGTYGDFIFQSQAKTHAAGLNSGYFFRAMSGTADTPSHGYESQINNGIIDGDRTKPVDAGTGAIFRRQNARYVVPNDLEWFTTTLIAHGPRICVWVDGYQVVDWTDDRAPDENPRKGLRLEPGHISLQGHDPTTDLSFRNLRITAIESR